VLGAWIAAGDGTSWFPSWWRLCLLTVLEITLAYRYLGRPGPSSAHQMMRAWCSSHARASSLPHVVRLVAQKVCPSRVCWQIMPPSKPQGEAAMGDSQRLSDTEQLEILALLEAVSTERSAMRAARALAELMRHVHDLGQRIAAELPDQDRDIKPARR
jgi:hypothetical protein